MNNLDLNTDTNYSNENDQENDFDLNKYKRKIQPTNKFSELQNDQETGTEEDFEIGRAHV